MPIFEAQLPLGMIKNILTVSLLSIVQFGFCQTKEFVFLPKWKAGETKKVSIVQHETEYKKGELTKDTTTYLSYTIAVMKENPDDYQLKVLYTNVALSAATEFYDKMGDELTQYKNLELLYKVDKQTGKATLENWLAAQKFMNESFEQINALLKKKVPDMASVAKFAFAPIKKLFKSKENIESYMTDQIGYLFSPYNKKLVPGDTLSVTVAGANPLNPVDTINQTTLTYLGSVNESKKNCDILSKEIFDLSGFKKMMVSMMEKMSAAFGAADSSQAKARNEINSINFDVNNLTTISFDYGTSWPVKVVKTSTVLATDPRGKSENMVKSVATIE